MKRTTKPQRVFDQEAYDRAVDEVAGKAMRDSGFEWDAAYKFARDALMFYKARYTKEVV